MLLTILSRVGVACPRSCGFALCSKHSMMAQRLAKADCLQRKQGKGATCQNLARHITQHCSIFMQSVGSVAGMICWVLMEILSLIDMMQASGHSAVRGSCSEPIKGM